MSNRTADASPANVKDFFSKAREALRLEALFQEVGFPKKIKADASGRIFSNLQVWDHEEMEALVRLSPEERSARFTESFRKGVASVIFAAGMEVPDEAEARLFRLDGTRSLFSVHPSQKSSASREFAGSSPIFSRTASCCPEAFYRSSVWAL